MGLGKVVEGEFLSLCLPVTARGTSPASKVLLSPVVHRAEPESCRDYTMA